MFKKIIAIVLLAAALTGCAATIKPEGYKSMYQACLDAVKDEKACQAADQAFWEIVLGMLAEGQGESI